MKFLLTILIFPVLIWLHPQPEPHKIALVIAVGSYAPETGWKTISSAHDIPYVRATLLAQGFAAADIDTLANEQATRAGIMKAIDRLIERARPGDIVVFHFSGHGQQIFDDGKKDEADGYDEALVPYDAPMRYGNGYTGQNHLRDDELGEKLRALRGKIGSSGSLLVLLDACHSGTATRGQEIALARGTDIRCEPPGYTPASATRGTPAANEGVFDDSDLLSNMVVISAAGADQLNYETRDAADQGVGSLSYAFSLAMTQLGKDADYSILFEKIKTLIQSWKPFQNPQIEGNPHQEILGGKFLPAGDLLRVESWTGNQVTLPRGTLNGLLAGTSFRIYPVAETDYTKPPVCTGTIGEAGLLKSTGQVSATRPDEKEAYKAVLDSENMGDIRVAVKIDLGDAAMAEQLKTSLSNLSFISLTTGNADVAISENSTGPSKQLQVWCSNDSVIWRKPWPQERLSELETDAIGKSIRQYARAQFLRALGSGESDKSFPYVSVEFVPGLVRSVNGTDTLTDRKSLEAITNAQGNIEFAEADDAVGTNAGFVIRIRNLHDFPVYFSVLDIQPDNQVNVTIPDPADPYSTAEDFKVMPKQVFETRPIKLYPPYGREFMKVLISRQAMDLKGIQTRSASRGNGTSFEAFYNDSFKDGASSARGTHMTPVKVDEVRIVPFSFLIVEK